VPSEWMILRSKLRPISDLKRYLRIQLISSLNSPMVEFDRGRKPRSNSTILFRPRANSTTLISTAVDFNNFHFDRGPCQPPWSNSTAVEIRWLNLTEITRWLKCMDCGRNKGGRIRPRGWDGQRETSLSFLGRCIRKDSHDSFKQHAKFQDFHRIYIQRKKNSDDFQMRSSAMRSFLGNPENIRKSRSLIGDVCSTFNQLAILGVI